MIFKQRKLGQEFVMKGGDEATWTNEMYQKGID